jgi:hypothetical protein
MEEFHFYLTAFANTSYCLGKYSYSENHTKPTTKFHGQKAELIYMKASGT